MYHLKAGRDAFLNPESMVQETGLEVFGENFWVVLLLSLGHYGKCHVVCDLQRITSSGCHPQPCLTAEQGDRRPTPFYGTANPTFNL